MKCLFEPRRFEINALYLFPGYNLSIKYILKNVIKDIDIAETKLYFENRTKVKYCDTTYIDEKFRKSGPAIYGYNRSFYNFETKYVHYRSVYFNSWIGIAKFSEEKGVANMPYFFYNGIFLGPFITNISNTPAQVYTREFENVILIRSVSDNVFGHFIWDYLTSFVLFPDEVIKKSYIFARDDEVTKYVYEVMPLLYGVTPSQIVFRDDDYKKPIRWYYATNLYAIDAPSGAYTNTGILTNFTRKLKSALIKEEKPPYRYCLYNRDIYTACVRIIPNFDDLTDRTEDLYPYIYWERIYNMRSMTEAARTYNEIRFFVTPSGSGLFNCIFMQPGTVILDIMAYEFNHVDTYLAHEFQFFIVIFSWSSDVGAYSRRWKEHPVVLSEYEHYLKIALEIDKTKKFPSSYHPFTGFKCWTWKDEKQAK